MGITKLLPRLEAAAREVSVYDELQGKSVAVDSFVWLHTLAVVYVEDVVEHQRYDRVSAAFAKRGRRFLSRGIDVLFVFDGKPVPAKAETAEQRRERRARALAEAQGAEPGSDEHRKALQAAVSIGPELVAAVISALRRDGQRYMVAPYEADPQLRYLDKKGIVDYVISVDSDMVPLGVRRPLLKFKYATGKAVLYERLALLEPKEPYEDELLDAFAATPSLLLLYCVGSGCDYFKMAGVGPGKSERTLVQLVRSGEEVTENAFFTALLAHATDGDSRHDHYRTRFYGALHAFRDAIVYDPRVRSETYLSDVTTEPNGARDFVGTRCEDSVRATDSALGFIPPELRRGMEVFVRDENRAPSQCITGTVVDATARGVRLSIDGQDEKRMRPNEAVRLCLPTVVSACRNCGRFGATLTFDQCPGAVLPDSEDEWTHDKMNMFMQTRRVPIDQGRKDQKVAKVKEILANEKRSIANGERIRLHDETGVSIFEVMEAELVDSAKVTFREKDDMRPPPADDESWISGSHGM